MYLGDEPASSILERRSRLQRWLPVAAVLGLLALVVAMVVTGEPM